MVAILFGPLLVSSIIVPMMLLIFAAFGFPD
jgi:hypothetical protein